MNNYVVIIEETLRRRLNVSASSEQEAMKIVRRMYESGQVVLNADDFSEAEYYVRDGERIMGMESEGMTVEPCPYCEYENVYRDIDAAAVGYRAVCKRCGKEIMLCDMCQHAEDNDDWRRCDWRKTPNGRGDCFRMREWDLKHRRK